MNDSYQDALAFYGIDGAHPGGFQLTKQLLHDEKITPYTKVLDAGCGTGQTSAYLAKTFSCQVYALDQHPNMLKKAKTKFKKEHLPIHLIQGSLEKLPFSDQFFDLIVAESSTAFTNIPKSLSEYARVLKPNGVLLTIDMTAEPQLELEAKTELIQFYEIQDLLTEKEWLQALKRSGFKQIQILKANTVLNELMNMELDVNDDYTPTSFSADSSLEHIILTHQNLTLSYGDRLGYRVFRAGKIDLPYQPHKTNS